MTATFSLKTVGSYWLAAFILLACRASVGQETPMTREQFLLLQEQNRQMQEQLTKQAGVIDSLSRKVSELEEAKTKPEATAPIPKPDSPANEGFRLGKVVLGAEGSVGFFASQPNGQFPNAEFRVDEAYLFLEAPVWKDVYFYSRITLTEHESTDMRLNVAELYLDFENISKWWGGQDGLLTLRVGRFYTPFGEEYQQRFAIDNPLISHSVSDLWGEDEGLEFFGKAGRFQYVLAVQNGGIPTSQDFNADKAITARLGYDPTDWLHLSVSGMRTGNLDTQGDMVSAMWFGGGFFRSLNFANATHFHADLVEGDVQLHFPQCELKAAGGYVSYDDNDPTQNNHRDVYYYYVEGTHNLTQKIYAAARFSQVLADQGFPIVGSGSWTEYFDSGELTSNYWRLSLGLGYRFSRNLVVKGEYSFNQGRVTTGEYRGQENLFALAAAFRF